MTVIWISGALLLTAAGLVVFFLFRETGAMAPLNTGEIVPGVFALRDSYVNFFLVKGAQGYIAVDAGKTEKSVLKEVRTADIDPNRVSAVFLTHSDFDHAGGIRVFNNAEVFISREELQLLNGTVKRFGLMKNKLQSAFTLLEDGQKLTRDGVSVECLLLQGHTPGSMAYRVNGRWLFTGDSLRLENGRVKLFNEFLNMDSKQQKESLKKLSRLKGVEALFTAHYGYTDNVPSAFAAWDDGCVYHST